MHFLLKMRANAVNCLHLLLNLAENAEKAEYVISWMVSVAAFSYKNQVSVLLNLAENAEKWNDLNQNCYSSDALQWLCWKLESEMLKWKSRTNSEEA